MIEATEFLRPAVGRGYTFWTGVPCSFLTPFINCVIQDPSLVYVGAASEGEAVGIASGALLAGRKAVVICQNSGLGNTVNPLTSLTYPFRIPLLLIVTHRGAPGLMDEPQHELMGKITGDLLRLMEVPWEVFPDQPEQIEPALERAEEAQARSGRPFAFLMKKGTVAGYPLAEFHRKPALEPAQPRGAFTRTGSERMSRLEAIRTVRDSLTGGEALIATTGKIGRELCSLGHRSNQLYVIGSMGCASGIGLGVHEGSGGRRRVVVLDGDGTALMKLGTLSTVGHHRPKGMLHVVIDNEAHESTGGQATASPTTDFATVAVGCGYRRAWRVDGVKDLAGAVAEALGSEGPALIHVKVALGSAPELGRPSLRPEQVKEQFVRWLACPTEGGARLSDQE